MAPTTITLISWNVAGRRCISDQMAALAPFDPDLISLQEVTKYSSPRWIEALHTYGYTHIISSYNLIPNTKGPRRYGILLAARTPLRPLDLTTQEIPWPERLLGVELEGELPLNWISTHIPPGSSNGWVKVEMLEAVQRVVCAHRGHPLILCGDLNCPQAEREDGVITWAQRIRPDESVTLRRRVRGRPAERWDQAERALTDDPQALGLTDAVRACLPLPAPEYSFVLRRKRKQIRRRFDHVFISDPLQPLEARYLHDLRLTSLSDHAPVLVTIEVP